MDKKRLKKMIPTSVSYGRDYELMVQNKLWRFGYAVTRNKSGAAFDLLIDDKIKVEVKGCLPNIGRGMQLYWRFDVGNNRTRDTEEYKFDSLVLVLVNHIGNPVIKYYGVEETNQIKEHLDETGRTSFSIKNGDDFIYRLGKNSPVKAFGKPKKLSTV